MKTNEKSKGSNHHAIFSTNSSDQSSVSSDNSGKKTFDSSSSNSLSGMEIDLDGIRHKWHYLVSKFLQKGLFL